MLGWWEVLWHLCSTAPAVKHPFGCGDPIWGTALYLSVLEARLSILQSCAILTVQYRLLVIQSLLLSAAQGFAKHSRSFCIILYWQCLSAVIIWLGFLYISAVHCLSLWVSLFACHPGVAFLTHWLPSPVITFGTRFASRLSTLAPVFPFCIGQLSEFLLPLHSSTALYFYLLFILQ